MKKILNIIILAIIILILFIPNVKAVDLSTYELNLKVLENTENKEFDLYILLPKSYIVYAIDNSNLNIEYTGAETLKENNIPGIDIDKNTVEDEIYKENDNEYVQILLEPNEDNEYTFNILSSYIGKDMKFRIKNDEKDYIMHLDNFTVKDNTCQLEYNYSQNSLKQKDYTEFTFSTVLFIILIIIVFIAIIAKIKGSK